MDNKDKLYGAIMNIPCQAVAAWGSIAFAHYKLGHRDARHAAADLVNKSAAQAEQTRPTGDLSESEITGLAKLADRIEEADEQPMVIARSAARAIDKLLVAHLASQSQAAQSQAYFDALAMARRFLGWKMPVDFSPDSGIAFTPYPDPLLWPVGTNLFNEDQAKAMFEYCLKDAVRPTDDDLWEQTLRDRDTNAEWADKLANAIAEHFGADIGEHSNMNCPWAESLEVIECAHLAGQSQVAQPPVKTWEDRTDDTTPGAVMMAMEAEITDLRAAKSHLVQQAQIWHDEAKAQRATVLDILRHFGLPEHDWEAKRLIVAHLAGQSQAARAAKQAVALFEQMLEAEFGKPGWPSVYDVEQCIKMLKGSAAQEVTQQAAKAETAEQAEGVQANVLPPFAAPAGQHDAIWSAIENYAHASAVYAYGTTRAEAPSQRQAKADACANLEAELASRFRAQGGNTNTESSDLAPTTSTVSAPGVQMAAKLEAIAQSWDECICEGIGEDREIGAVLREQFAKIVAPSSTVSAPNEIRNQALKDAAKRCEEVAFDWDQAGETRKHSAAVYLANCILDMRTDSAVSEPEEPYGWVFGNSFWERGNPRITDEVRQLGKPLFDRPALRTTSGKGEAA